MHPFQIITTEKKEEAVKSATNPNTKYIGGGTNLVDLMKLNIEKPHALIDIGAIDLKQIDVTTNGSLLVGALVTNTDLAYRPEVLLKYPFLSEAILSGASPQIRNVATIAGNMLQRTRCPYFYDAEFQCNKRQPASGCSAINGYNRNHAILGTSEHCIATHPSDMCVAFSALNVIVHTYGNNGLRKISFRDFHPVPGSKPYIESALKQGELITHIEIPLVPFATRSSYIKVRDRSSYEFALASAAVALDLHNGKIREARVALGGVGTKPWHSPEAEEVLRNGTPGERIYQRAADAALANAKTFDLNAFKVELAKRTLIKALSTAETR